MSKKIDSNATFAARTAMLRAHRLADTSKDMQAVNGSSLTSPFVFTAAVNARIDAMGIDTTSVFAVDRNPKVIKRFIQFVHAINHEDYKNVDRTSATIVYALQLSGESPLTVDALHYIGAGLKSGKVSPETRGVSRRAVNKLFGAVGLSTIPTQTSRTVGKNGFLNLIGATVGEPGKRNQSVTLNPKHALIEAFFALMNKATDAQLDAVAEGKKA